MSGADGRPLVLVAGGTGFLGAAFVRALDDRGVPVAVLSRSPARARRRFPGRAVEARGGDVTDTSTLPAAVRGAGAVIQCVQFPGYPVEDPRRGRTFMNVDAGGTRNLVAACAGEGVRKVVYLSGVGAAPDAAEAWFRAKAIAEAAVRESGLLHAIVRPSWVYGPEDRSLSRLAVVLRRVPLVFPQPGDGSQRLNPVFVRDIAEVVARCTTEERIAAETIEIGGPVTYTMDQVVRMLMEAIGRRKPILHVPLGLARPLAAVGEVLPGQLLSRDALRFVTQGAVADLTGLRRLYPDLRLTPMPDALGVYA